MSTSTQRVQAAIEKNGFTMQVIELSSSTRTAQEAALTLNCSVAQIVKSLVFCTVATKKPILVLVSGVNRVNEATITKAIGEPVIKAEADFIREVTGFAIGGVPPVGHKTPLQTFIDEDLMALSELWAAAGTPFAVFKLNASELCSLTHGTVINIKHPV